MSFVVILLLLGIAWYFFNKQPEKPALKFPDNWKSILHDKVIFYGNLEPPEKEKFEAAIMNFLSKVKITGVQTAVDLTDKLLIASSAIIPVFGFPGWEYSFLDEVLLYPSSFDSDFNIGSKEEFIQGMVGNGRMEGKMILSKKALHVGFSNDRDKRNVGIHEFIHLIDKEDGLIDGIPTVLNDKVYSLPWLNLTAEKIRKMTAEDIGINPYGATNKQEFLAVAGEYFFERPHMLKSHHPELFELLKKAFNQDPTGIIRSKKVKLTTIGRNDPCPCGSGLKFKKCCMNK